MILGNELSYDRVDLLYDIVQMHIDLLGIHFLFNDKSVYFVKY